MQTTENKNKIKIGNVVINSKVSLAPLAGITDFVLRQLIREYSSTCLLTTEMLSSEALVQRPDANIAYTNGTEEPAAFQIEGHKPDLMARSAKILESRATIIDINMGCPIKKIVNGNDGCSLMKNPELAKDIVIAVKESVKIPVTCKFRLGWSNDTKNFVEFAQLMQEAGASAVTVHGRTRFQMYAGTADWKEISKLKATREPKSLRYAKKLQLIPLSGLNVGRKDLENDAKFDEMVQTIAKLDDRACKVILNGDMVYYKKANNLKKINFPEDTFAYLQTLAAKLEPIKSKIIAYNSGVNEAAIMKTTGNDDGHALKLAKIAMNQFLQQN